MKQKRGCRGGCGLPGSGQEWLQLCGETGDGGTNLSVSQWRAPTSYEISKANLFQSGVCISRFLVTTYYEIILNGPFSSCDEWEILCLNRLSREE